MKTLRFKVKSRHDVCILAEIGNKHFLLNMKNCVINLIEPSVIVETLKGVDRIIINDQIWFDTEQAEAILQFFEGNHEG